MTRHAAIRTLLVTPALVASVLAGSAPVAAQPTLDERL